MQESATLPIEGQGQSIQKQRRHPPRLPWPASQPGPYATPPPPGYRPVPTRTDQVMKVEEASSQEREMFATG